MEEVLLTFCKEYELSPFHESKTSMRSSHTVFKTADARAVHTRVLQQLSKPFAFADSSMLWQCFPFTQSVSELEQRQRFFSGLLQGDRSFLSSLTVHKPTWKASYGVIVVTEDESLFSMLREREIPVKYMVSEYDLQQLESYDVVQVIGCEQFRTVLERLPQTVFLQDSDEAYLERHVETLSSWSGIIQTLIGKTIPAGMQKLVEQLNHLIPLCSLDDTQVVTYDRLQAKLTEVNEHLSGTLKTLVLTGDSLLALLHKETLPVELQQLVRTAVTQTGLPGHLFSDTIPLQFNEQEVDQYLKRQQATAFTQVAERIRKHAGLLMHIPQLLDELARWLLVFDFCSGVQLYCASSSGFPLRGEQVKMVDSRNMFIPNAQPITFMLDQGTKCSVLTGANSGGKTTLLEHIVQLVSLQQLGLPVQGIVELPLFTEVYYFAKNKGSMSKGAFETLLTQLASVQPSARTLILADEIEAVTEPGVAGVMICATIAYFVQRNCFMVIATHLGQEVHHMLPAGSRIDGIEAKGLNEQFELIVDHNPVLGRLANSTPELIVERMAKTQAQPYFTFVYEYLQTRTNK